MNINRNSLIISKIGGGKSTRLVCQTLLLLIICATFGACAKPKPADGEPVEISASLFYNHDSVLYYAERAYMYDDAKGQFVLGAAAYLRRQGDLPDEIYTLPLNQADSMLIRSAEQGYQPAIDLIRCLNDHEEWHHDLPNEK